MQCPAIPPFLPSITRVQTICLPQAIQRSFWDKKLVNPMFFDSTKPFSKKPSNKTQSAVLTLHWKRNSNTGKNFQFLRERQICIAKGLTVLRSKQSTRGTILLTTAKADKRIVPRLSFRFADSIQPGHLSGPRNRTTIRTGCQNSIQRLLSSYYRPMS